MDKIKKFIISVLAILVYFLHFSFFTWAKEGLTDDAVGLIDKQDAAFINKAGFSASSDIGSLAKIVIQGFLGLLGIIFVILMLTAGYNWMTASGNEEKLKKAQTTIRLAIIGLIITVFAYAITYFVFSALPYGTGGAGSGGLGGTF